jgi:hypothetical protein
VALNALVEAIGKLTRKSLPDGDGKENPTPGENR